MEEVVCFILRLAFWAIIAWIVLYYVVELGRVPWSHPVRKLHQRISRVLDPVFRPVRRMIPALRAGTTSIDLTPIIMLIVLQLLIAVIC